MERSARPTVGRAGSALALSEFPPIESTLARTNPSQQSAWTEADTSRFEHLVTEAIAASPTDADVALLAVNVDHFDVVSATHGIEVGSEIMRTVANRIRAAIRPGDPIEQCSEHGYAMLYVSTATTPDIREVANRIASQFDEPVMTTAGQLAVTMSVGMTSTTGRSTSTDARMLLRQAKSAVASAQRNGRSQFAVFDEAIRQQVLEGYELEQQLRSALHNRQVGVSYQPVMSLHSGDVISVEAVARWNHQTLGDVSPHTFIPIAEQSGLICRLGRSLFGQVMMQGRQWIHEHKDLRLSVNVSKRQLVDPELLPMTEKLIAESQLDPRSFSIEISESVVMSDVTASMTILGRLKDLGFHLAIDDFGTGYSSLSYLHRLPVDALKIDRSFVQGMYSRDDRVITKAIIDLAHTLGMETVAQGVETHLQAEVLHALNCDMAQGLYLHPPATADKVNFSSIDFEMSGFSENLGSSSALATKAPAFAQR